MNLYVASASPDNLEPTVLSSVRLDAASPFLTPSQQQYLAGVLDGSLGFHCWAMTENLRSHFAQMEAGDAILISEHGTGLFNYVARVIGKLESASLGNYLWRIQPREPVETHLPTRQYHQN